MLEKIKEIIFKEKEEEKEKPKPKGKAVIFDLPEDSKDNSTDLWDGKPL